MAEQTLACTQCGAELKFAPGVASLKCPYCNHQIEIEISPEALGDAWIEQDFHAILGQLASTRETVEVQTVKCSTCAAETTFDPETHADECAYCGGTLVQSAESSHKLLKPQALLPFRIEQKAAFASFRAWLSGLWFAPNAVKKYARVDTKLQGVYVPYWTYDTQTETRYSGQRGEHYWDTEHYTDAQGNRKTRRVRKTRWYPASGTVRNSFDDVLVLASESLPRKHAEKLEPWDLHELAPYNEDFLRGFRAESYAIELDQGFERAKELMDPTITRTVRHDIGGDEQRIFSKRTRYDNVSFKYLLLPIWLSAFRYQNKVYRFLVNARTGEVQGERPWSWIKITGAALAAAIVIGLIIFFASQN